MFVGSLANGASAQTVIDPSACFPDLLRDVSITNASDQFKLSYLSILDINNFEAHKTTAAAMLPGLPAAASFSQFDVRRTREFNLKNLNIESVRKLAIYTFTLNPAAKDIISKCLDTLVAAKGYGFFLIPYDISERTLNLQFRWRSTDPTGKLSIGDSTLGNAEVFAPRNVPAGRVLPLKASFTGTSSRNVILTRTKVKEPIIIQLDDVKPESIDVPPLVFRPVPAPVSCKREYLSADPNTGVPYQIKQSTPLETAGVYDNPPVAGKVGARFHITVKLDDEDAVVSSVTCSKGSQDHMCLDNSPGCDYAGGPVPGNTVNNTTAFCAGSSESNPRVVEMVVNYKKPAVTCTTAEWPGP